jgi:hypothetical protein
MSRTSSAAGFRIPLLSTDISIFSLQFAGSISLRFAKEKYTPRSPAAWAPLTQDNRLPAGSKA